MNAVGKKPLDVLRRRTEFLAIAKGGKKWVAPGLILQMSAAYAPEAPSPIRYGLTASRKIGGAVIRNRARRRLRALAVGIFPLHAVAGHDYIIIARAATPRRAHRDLERDLVGALKKLGAWRDNA